MRWHGSKRQVAERRPSRQRRQSLRIEPLEQRIVLATFFVSNLADSGAGSLREAIHMSNQMPGADTVQFETGVAGTIFISSELEINGGVTINGPGAEIVTIDAQQGSRVIREDSYQPVTIRGLTITGGRTVRTGADGGGIATERGEFTLEHSVITGNSTQGGGADGGGIAVFGGDVFIRDSVITQNHTSGSGSAAGGIFTFYTYDVELIDSTISDNYTSGPDAEGGGIWGNMSVTLTNSTVTGNSTRGPNSPGGAVFIAGNEFFPRLNAEDSSVTGNWTAGTSSPGGAAFGSVGSIVQFTRSNVENNRTESDNSPGGAVAMAIDAFLFINDSTLSHNHTEGDAAGGGGVFVESEMGLDSDATIDSSTLSHNHTEGESSPGGAIYTTGFYADVAVTDSVLTQNQTRGPMSQGGAVAMFGAATLDLADSTITQNATLEADSPGGAIYMYRSYATIERANVSANYTLGANSNGGAIVAQFVSLIDSTVSGNQTSGDAADGGGIHVRGTIDVIRSAVVLNAASGAGADGGGIAIDYSYFTTRVVNSTISGNSAAQSGGGVAVLSADQVEIKHSTITENVAPLNQGSGVAYSDASANVMVDNSILSGNGGTDVDAYGIALGSVVNSGGFNIVGSGSAIPNFSNNDQTSVSNPLLGSLQSNGGFAPSHLPLPGSPAIDMGDPAVVNPPASDQRGFPFERIYSATGTPRLDVGAIEVQPLPGDFDMDGDYDCADIDALIAAIMSGGATFDLNGDGFVDLADRDLWLQLAGNFSVGSGQAYLLGDANLDGVVDGLDFIVWNTNKFAMAPADPGWCDGNFNADRFVDGIDFIIWNANKFQSILPPTTPSRISLCEVTRVARDVGEQELTSKPAPEPLELPPSPIPSPSFPRRRESSHPVKTGNVDSIEKREGKAPAEPITVSISCTLAARQEPRPPEN